MASAAAAAAAAFSPSRRLAWKPSKWFRNMVFCDYILLARIGCDHSFPVFSCYAMFLCFDEEVLEEVSIVIVSGRNKSF